MKDILVIDDDELMRELVSEWLADAGYEPRQAVDGEAGIEALQRQPRFAGGHGHEHAQARRCEDTRDVAP